MQMYPNACRLLGSHTVERKKKKGFSEFLSNFVFLEPVQHPETFFCAVSLCADHYTCLLVGSDSLK